MIEFCCPEHGFLAETFPDCVVVCKCRRRALRFRNGVRLSRQDLHRLTSKSVRKTPANRGVLFSRTARE